MMSQSAEWIAVACAIINIVLLIRRSVWNYPFGIATVVIYAWIFAGERLYSDVGLQIFFVIVQCLGWRVWLRSGGDAGPVAVNRLPNAHRLIWLLTTGIAALMLGLCMDSWTIAARPYWDAAVAMCSVAAQLLLVRRMLENWAAWIIVDLLAIGLYVDRGLLLTACLYGLLLILSVIGLFKWAKAEQNDAACTHGTGIGE